MLADCFVVVVVVCFLRLALGVSYLLSIVGKHCRAAARNCEERSGSEVGRSLSGTFSLHFIGSSELMGRRKAGVTFNNGGEMG